MLESVRAVAERRAALALMVRMMEKMVGMKGVEMVEVIRSCGYLWQRWVFLQIQKRDFKSPPKTKIQDVINLEFSHVLEELAQVSQQKTVYAM